MNDRHQRAVEQINRYMASEDVRVNGWRADDLARLLLPQEPTLTLTDDERRVVARALELAELWFDAIEERRLADGEEPAAKDTLMRVREMVGEVIA